MDEDDQFKGNSQAVPTGWMCQLRLECSKVILLALQPFLDGGECIALLVQVLLLGANEAGVGGGSDVDFLQAAVEFCLEVGS